jgi:5'-AMP-activated protein kinase regulatory beta subunit
MPPVIQNDEENETVPVEFRWRLGGREVFVSGSFNDWKGKMQLKQSEFDECEFSLVLKVLPGRHNYRYIVDQQWQVNDEEQTEDVQGIRCNIVDVKRSVFEDSRVTFENSDDDEENQQKIGYSQRIPDATEYIKDAPKLPPHYFSALLNAPPYQPDPYQLPMPSHVTLNHLYVLEGASQTIIVTSISQRFRTTSFADSSSKFVTTVFYAPRDDASPGSPAESSTRPRTSGVGTAL